MLRRITLMKLSVCLIAVVLARVLGGSDSPPFSAMLADPDGHICTSICLFGIEPGKTTYQDAIHILHRHPLTRSLSWKSMMDVYHGTDPYAQLRVRIRGDIEPIPVLSLHNKVWQIKLYSNPDIPSDLKLTLRFVIATWGTPSWIRIQASQTLMYYPTSKAILICRRQNEDWLSLEDVLEGVSYSDSFPGEEVWKEWRGFTRIQRYI